MARPKVDTAARKKQQSAHYARTDEAFYEQVKAENGGELPADLVGPDGQPRKLTQGPEDEHYRRRWRRCAAEQRKGETAPKRAGGSTQACPKEQQPRSKKPCGIKSMTVGCDNPKRSVASGGTLQVVPRPTSVLELSMELRPFGLPIRMSGKRRYGGNDVIRVQVQTVDPPQATRVQACLMAGDEEPQERDWKRVSSAGAEFSVDGCSCSADVRWTQGEIPKVFTAHGRGCDDPTQSAVVEVYPNDATEVSVSLEFAEALTKKLSKGVSAWIEESWLGEKCGIECEMEGPKGGLSLAWGWEESDDDWRAAFVASAKADLRLFGLKFQKSFNLRDTALEIGLSAIGIPPSVAMVAVQMAKKAAKYAAKLGDDKPPDDPLDYLTQVKVTLTAGVEFSTNGEIKGKCFSSGGASWDPGLSGDCKGSFEVAIKGQVGHEKLWNCLSIEGAASTGLEGGLRIEVDSSGVFMSPSVKFPGLSLRVTCEGMVMKRSAKSEATWEVFREKELYPGDSGDRPRWELIGKGSNVRGR